MPARCLNKVMLIGNLTRDPELRYTPSGSAVCSFGLATNRYWSTETGEKKEDAQFHRIVSWNKLAEICSQLLGKGDKIYLEGRLQTRQWTGADGVSRKTTEIVISDMILLRSRRGREGEEEIETPAEGALRAQAPTEEEVTEPAEEKEGKEKKEEGEGAGEGEGAVVAAADDALPEDKEKKGKKEKKEKEPETEEKEKPAEEEAEEGGEGEEEVEIPEDKTPF